MTDDLTTASDAGLSGDRLANLDVVERFFDASFDGEARQSMWAPDGELVLMFTRSGPRRFAGVAAISERAREAAARVWEFTYDQVDIQPMLDPGLFVVRCHSTARAKRDGSRVENDYINLVRVVNRKIVERLEYFDPLREP